MDKINHLIVVLPNLTFKIIKELNMFLQFRQDWSVIYNTFCLQTIDNKFWYDTFQA